MTQEECDTCIVPAGARCRTIQIALAHMTRYECWNFVPKELTVLSEHETNLLEESMKEHKKLYQELANHDTNTY